MTDTAIRVENLSKRYRIGQAEERHDTFAGAAIATLKAPLRNFRNLRRLASFEGRSNVPTLQRSNVNGVADDVLWALKDVSFEVKQGEVVGVIGRNGAGKSTLLKILSRITEPTSGLVELHGRVSSLLEVGTGFHPELTGRENIYLNGTILGMRKHEIDRKFDEIVDFSGVEKFIDTPVKRYSSGMRVRLAFSVAAHLEPEILLVDEVLAVGDAEFQSKCIGKMGEVASAGRTVLFVSHNMVAVQNLCKRTIWLESGGISANGETGEVIKEYLDRTTNLVGTPLSSRHNREGDGRLRLRELIVRDSNEKTIRVARSGQDVTFELVFDFSEETALRDVAFQISFLNEMGQRLFILLTRFAEGNFSEIKVGDRVRCRVPFLPLLPGDYILHLYAKQGYELLDGVEEAAQLQVKPSDVFGTGKLQGTEGGNIVVPHSWCKA